MDYFTSGFLLTGHKCNTWVIMKENNEVYTIEYNNTNNIWRENGKMIVDFEDYCNENKHFIEKSQKSYVANRVLINDIKKYIKKELKYSDETIEINIGNKFIDLKVVINKILPKTEKTINFIIKVKENNQEINKMINDEQLVNFILKNKHILNYHEEQYFSEKQKYSLLSNQYKKLFIKRSKDKRIYAQSCKESFVKFNNKNFNDVKLKDIQQFVREHLQCLNLNDITSN